MNSQQFLSRCDYFDLVHGVTVRAIGALSDTELSFRPAKGMRSPRELIFHVYAQEKIVAEGTAQGRLSMEATSASNPEGGPGAAECAKLVTVAAARAYAEACHRAAAQAFRAMSNDELARPVESPFGTYPAWQYFTFVYDEHWHHRGQLYAYLRLLGKEPPILYDYQATGV